jgi:hypothetical protein
MATKSGGNPPPGRPDQNRFHSVPDTSGLELDAAAQALLASLEESLRPKELAEKFPRIVNRMASLWNAPRRMNRYLEQLLTDARTHRKGFTIGILNELTALKDYYQTKVFPVPHDVWDAAEESEGRDF